MTTDTKLLLFTIAIGLLLILVFLGMFFAWRKRSRHGARLAPAGRAALTGEVLLTLDRILYVATTPKDARLDRVAVPGLRYRGYASLTVATDGVQIQVTGEHPVVIPAAQVTGLESGQLTIDKAVERNGLAMLGWRSGDTELLSAFRLPEGSGRTALREALSHPNFSAIPASTPHQEA
ncbi:PH-like domain-containing protein [Leucobacter sp. M11]|uniref:PH-like domain-containing protein n=1 Tax=Leucobacter sp. M11 TaxID=2993565 RepID=UPI002D806E85|nr:hypothetical protein [Leucobacter sp. M11]MEB4616246.1 hypothetical protein [Leucobacter sp. M11]